VLNPETESLVVQLGQPIASLLDRIGTPDADGLVEYHPEFEGVLADASEPKIWCRASKEFMLQTGATLKGYASAMLHVDYRRDTSQVWRVHLLDGSGRFALQVGPLPLRPGFDDLLTALGPPTRRIPFSEVLDHCWWLSGDVRAHAEVWSQDYPDLMRSWKAGEIQAITAWRASLGPSGYDSGASSFGGSEDEHREPLYRRRWFVPTAVIIALAVMLVLLGLLFPEPYWRF